MVYPKLDAYSPWRAWRSQQHRSAACHWWLRSRGASNAKHEVYESANDTWSTAAPLPTPRATLAVVTGSDGLIYAIGGYDGTNALTTVQAYAPDKCYPIEHQIALVASQLSAAESGLAEIPPQARAGAERELAALRAQISALETQLKECRAQ